MITAHAGTGHPLGPSVIHSTPIHISINLAIFSHKPLTIFIFPPRQSSQTFLREPVVNFPITSRTGNIYHIAIHNLPHHAAYALHPHGSGRLVHDPYAKFLESRSVDEWMTLPAVPRHTPNPFREFRRLLSAFPTLRKTHIRHPFILSLFAAPPNLPTASCDIPRPHVPHEQMVIYEAHVRALTRSGTFEAAVDVIPYLKWLGITTLQLMPVFEFDELETAVSDSLREPNMWGYSPASWFMPMGRYSARHASAGLKTLIRELHRAGIECILDAVYNHSGNSACPLHFFGVQRAYYIGNTAGGNFHHSKISGCGNTLSPNSPVMSDLIMESLRWFVAEYHVDGFRLDAAGVLCRDQNGKPIQDPGIINRVAADPLLRDTKIIVEGWDAGDQIGSPNMLLGRFPRGEAVSEWNPFWRDVVRRFWRGDGDTDEFCEALRGCPRLFKSDRPHGACHSVNFAACHDGFCLADVVSYTKRVNNDGYDEVSFNCGAEGETTDAQVNARRAKQMRNIIMTLAVSRGIPMILQGDEVGFSKEGRSNTWNDPDRYVYPLPEKPYEVVDREALVQFTRHMFKLRRSYSQLTGLDFHRDISWVGIDGKRLPKGKAGSSEGKAGNSEGNAGSSERKKESSEGKAGSSERKRESSEGKTVSSKGKAGSSEGKARGSKSGFVAFVTGGNEWGEKLLLAFNGSTNDIKFTLPQEMFGWRLLVDTATAKWRRDSLINKEERETVTIFQQSSVLYVGRFAADVARSSLHHTT